MIVVGSLMADSLLLVRGTASLGGTASLTCAKGKAEEGVTEMGVGMANSGGASVFHWFPILWWLGDMKGIGAVSVGSFCIYIWANQAGFHVFYRKYFRFISFCRTAMVAEISTRKT